MLRAQQPARSGQRHVDRLGGQRGIARPRSGSLFQQRLHHRLERVESLPDLRSSASAGADFSHASESCLSRPCLRPSHSRRKFSTASGELRLAAALAGFLLQFERRNWSRGSVRRSSCVKVRINHMLWGKEKGPEGCSGPFGASDKKLTSRSSQLPERPWPVPPGA